MSLKQILVQAGVDAGAQRRVEIAADLANRFDAQLSGVFLTPAPPAAYLGGGLEAAPPAKLFSAPEHPETQAFLERVIASGHSQSAGRLATYFNAVHPLTPVYDAVLLHGGERGLVHRIARLQGAGLDRLLDGLSNRVAGFQEIGRAHV